MKRVGEKIQGITHVREKIGIIITFVVASFLSLSLSAGIEIKSPRLDALYRCGEKASFSVSVTDGSALMKTGEVRVVLDNFGTGVISSNVYSLAKGNPIKVKGTLGRPGFLRLTAAGAGGSAVWSVAYEPERLRPVTPLPADFDAFWSSARKKLAAEVPLDPVMTKVPERCTDKFDYYRISFATFGRRVHGYMSIPTDASRAPYPVELQVSAAGFGGWTNDMGGNADRINVFFAVYPFEPDWRWAKLGLQSKYDAMNEAYAAKYGCDRYSNAGSSVSREEYFFYPVILGIDRAIDWIAARPEVDPKKIRYQGTSQGGGMGLALTALNKHISRAVFFVPAMTDTLAGEAGLQSGWPQPVKNQRDEAARSVVRKVMPYFDGASFATRITCPVRYVIGLADTTCAPHCTWATFNALASKDKRLVYGIGMGHGVRSAFYTAMLHWLNCAPAKEPSVVSLTFDDDSRDFATDVSPLLVKYGWKGIFNVITDRVGRDKTQLTWDDIRAMRDAGHEIANHSVSHPHLKELVKEGNTNELRRQIVESRDILARELGRPPAWFCLPFNSGDETVRAMVVEAGMRSYGPGRKNYGAHQAPWTDNGVYVTLLKTQAEGKKPDDIMVHGVRAGRGFRPFDSPTQYEKHLQELQQLERDGFIRVLPYAAAHP